MRKKELLLTIFMLLCLISLTGSSASSGEGYGLQDLRSILREVDRFSYGIYTQRTVELVYYLKITPGWKMHFEKGKIQIIQKSDPSICFKLESVRATGKLIENKYYEKEAKVIFRFSHSGPCINTYRADYGATLLNKDTVYTHVLPVVLQLD